MSTGLTPTSSAEPILCDTSFISVFQVKGWLPAWPTETQQRLNSAILGISVITIAATANTRGWPLVSCDKHFERIPDVDHIFLDPPATNVS